MKDQTTTNDGHTPNIKYVTDRNLCMGCGTCEGACPRRAISVVAEGGMPVPKVDAGLCINERGCHRCYDACPGVGLPLAAMGRRLFAEGDGGADETREGAEEELTASARQGDSPALDTLGHRQVLSESSKLAEVGPAEDQKAAVGHGTPRKQRALHDPMTGWYRQCFTGHSNDHDIRWHSASGGLVSQLLVWLLETGRIDGAVVTRFDNDEPLMCRTYIATTRDDVLDARSSKYGPVTMAGMARAVVEASGTRYVVVGLPCHVQGWRKLMALDARLRAKVVGLLAIYCSSGRTFGLTERVMEERGIDRSRLCYFAYRDEGCLGSMVAITDHTAPAGAGQTTGAGGRDAAAPSPEGPGATSAPGPSPAAEGRTPGAEGGGDQGIRISHRNSETYLCKGEKRVYKDRYQNFYHPLRSIFIPRRCLFCIDHYGELGDVCFGDIHVEPYSSDTVGTSSVVARSQRWLDLLRECARDGAITLDEVPFATVSRSQKMSFKKKRRNAAFIALVRRMGMAVPAYDTPLPRPTLRDGLDYAQNRLQQWVGRHRSLWWAIPLLKSRKKYK